MAINRRIHFQNQPAGTGGGGGPTPALVAWGPDFGDEAGNDNVTHEVGVNTDISELGLSHTRTIGVNTTMPALGLSSDRTIALQHSMSRADVNFNAQTVGVATNLSLVNVTLERGIGVQTAISSLSSSADRTIGVDLAGTALGAPFWQSVETGTGTDDTGTVSVPIPDGTVAGDLLLAFVGYTKTGSSPASVSVPSGWTLARHQGLSGSVNSSYKACFYKIANGSEGTDQSFSLSLAPPVGTLHRLSGEIHRVIGVDTTTPINATAAATLLSTALTPDPVSPSVTTTVVNCLVFASLQHDHLALTQTHTEPASHQELSDFEANNTGNITGSTTDIRVFASAGATGTVVHDCTETIATDAVMLRVAIAPGSVTIA